MRLRDARDQPEGACGEVPELETNVLPKLRLLPPLERSEVAAVGGEAGELHLRREVVECGGWGVVRMVGRGL